MTDKAAGMGDHPVPAVRVLEGEIVRPDAPGTLYGIPIVEVDSFSPHEPRTDEEKRQAWGLKKLLQLTRMLTADDAVIEGLEIDAHDSGERRAVITWRRRAI